MMLYHDSIEQADRDLLYVKNGGIKNYVSQQTVDTLELDYD